MGSKNNKKPKWGNEPQGGKNPKIRAMPESTDSQTLAWHFGIRDLDHAEWGWNKLGPDGFLELVQELCHFETMTWAELSKAVGDKRSGNKHHLIDVTACCKNAQDRLAAIKQDDVDQLFSLRLRNKLRLFGIRSGRVLRLIWHDQEHTVYQIKS